MKPTILIVEDNRALAMALAAKAAHWGFKTELAPTLALARKALAKMCPDVVLFDLGLPDGSGMELLNEQLPAAAIITAHGELDHAIAAKKAGVNEFFVKPVDFDALDQFLRTLVPRAGGEESAKGDIAGEFIGESVAMRPVIQKIARACASKRPVLISGSPGTGRSHVAYLIHRNSEKSGKLVVIDARSTNALPELKVNDAGLTVVLDHVEALALDQQVVLAKVFEEIGSGVRVIAICDRRGLLPAVKDHRFHPDLYYYLQGIEVTLPDLEERQEDFPALCQRFLGEIAGKEHLGISPRAIERLRESAWRGNLRQLRDVLQRAARTVAGGMVEVEDIPEVLVPRVRESSTDDPLALEIRHWVDHYLMASDGIPDYRELLAGIESRLLTDLLSRFDGKPSVLAHELKLNRSTLRKRLRELGLG